MYSNVVTAIDKILCSYYVSTECEDDTLPSAIHCASIVLLLAILHSTLYNAQHLFQRWALDLVCCTSCCATDAPHSDVNIHKHLHIAYRHWCVASLASHLDWWKTKRTWAFESLPPPWHQIYIGLTLMEQQQHSSALYFPVDSFFCNTSSLC